MPLTPLHHPIAYFIYKLDKRLSLPGLIVGCMFPDIETPFIVLLFGTHVRNRHTQPHLLVLGDPVGSLWMQIIMAVLVAVLIVVKRRNLFEELLVG